MAKTTKPLNTKQFFREHTGNHRLLLASAVAFLFLHALAPFTTAQQSQQTNISHQGPKNSRISIGMSTALTGPASKLGTDVRAGVAAAFHEANQRGGINGRKLELKVLDDGYEPSQTTPNMRQLIENDEVIAVIGNVGTPTAIAAIPIANSTKTLFFGAYTGAGVLRKKPVDRYVINYRASYEEETAAMVHALIEHAGIAPEQIAFFTQRDGYGDAGYNGGLQALKKFGLSDPSRIAHGRYERNTNLIEKGLAELLLHDAPIKAVIIVGAYQPAAKFIRLAKESGFSPIFLNVSFVGSASLGKALKSTGDNVIVTQVVPPPNSDSKLASAYQNSLQKHNPSAVPSHASFEGYIAARILLQAIATIESEPTRENVIDALESLENFSLDSLENLSLSTTEHQANHEVWPTVLKNGEVIPFDWTQLSVSQVGTENE